MTLVQMGAPRARSATLIGAFALLACVPVARAAQAPSPAYERGAEAYRAYAKGDFAAAVAAARAAAQLAPSDRGYQLLLMQSQAAAGDLAGAEQTAAAIVNRFGATGDLQAQRGFYALALHRPSDAASFFANALTLGDLSSSQVRTVRLALSDILIGSGRASQALDALAPIGAEPSYEVRSRQAQALLTLGPSEAALRACEQAAQLAPAGEQRAYFTRAAVLTAVKLGRQAEARAAFERGRASGALVGSEPVDLAMLAIAVGDDATAQVYFGQALKTGKLSGRAALDAAYSAKRLGRDADAAPYFRFAVERAARVERDIPADTLFAARRDLANMDRRWGVQGYLGYGGEGASFVVSPAEPKTATQAGVEVFRRLGGYRGGHTIEGFARAFETVASQSSSPTGPDTLQGWLGLRLRPFPDEKLQIEASRMVRLGNQARDDWMVRAAYSAGTPADVRPQGTAWWAWSLYLDGARVVNDRETLALADLRAGRAIALGSSGKIVLMPFVGLEAAYDDALARPWATGAGPGASLRVWFRETPDKAPQSYMDLSLQYRVRISGDRRGEGLFGVLSVAY